MVVWRRSLGCCGTLGRGNEPTLAIAGIRLHCYWLLWVMSWWDWMAAASTGFQDLIGSWRRIFGWKVGVHSAVTKLSGTPGKNWLILWTERLILWPGRLILILMTGCLILMTGRMLVLLWRRLLSVRWECLRETPRNGYS
ncbi:hypothetical protein BZA77DRAFT_144699 [Pyronema omphalodes]|nr:hypothetical protein BZA77DRAFT_144699 [Pyronema omphalodes]